MIKRQNGGIRRWVFCVSVFLISTTIVLASLSSKEQTLTSMVAGILTQFHYDQKKPMNDAWSERVFELYLKELDPNKVFFLESDILVSP